MEPTPEQCRKVIAVLQSCHTSDLKLLLLHEMEHQRYSDCNYVKEVREELERRDAKWTTK